ncbi:MAG: hypothetical protein K1X44_06120, partial [Alphaproteobacteria bacterium]|nr:hypothetical protein [Alphaproteobacteria bacterium]
MNNSKKLALSTILAAGLLSMGSLSAEILYCEKGFDQSAGRCAEDVLGNATLNGMNKSLNNLNLNTLSSNQAMASFVDTIVYRDIFTSKRTTVNLPVTIRAYNDGSGKIEFYKVDTGKTTTGNAYGSFTMDSDRGKALIDYAKKYGTPSGDTLGGNGEVIAKSYIIDNGIDGRMYINIPVNGSTMNVSFEFNGSIPALDKLLTLLDNPSGLNGGMAGLPGQSPAPKLEKPEVAGPAPSPSAPAPSGPAPVFSPAQPAVAEAAPAPVAAPA